MKGGGGESEQGGCLRIIVLILGQRPRTKRISCKGQAAAAYRGGLARASACYTHTHISLSLALSLYIYIYIYIHMYIYIYIYIYILNPQHRIIMGCVVFSM